MASAAAEHSILHEAVFFYTRNFRLCNTCASAEAELKARAVGQRAVKFFHWHGRVLSGFGGFI